MRTFSLMLLITVASASIALAQTPGPRASVSAVAGTGQTWDDEGGLGRGFVFGIRGDRRLWGHTSGEIALDVLTHDRDSGYFKANGHTTFLTVSLIRRFGEGPVQPYILGGGLIAWHSGTLTFTGGVPVEVSSRDENSTNGGFTVGTGFSVRAGERIEIGPEFRLLGMFVDDDSDPATAYWVGIRVAYRF
jgi:hypothetical protein